MPPRWLFQTSLLHFLHRISAPSCLVSALLLSECSAPSTHALAYPSALLFLLQRFALTVTSWVCVVLFSTYLACTILSVSMSLRITPPLMRSLTEMRQYACCIIHVRTADLLHFRFAVSLSHARSLYIIIQRSLPVLLSLFSCHVPFALFCRDRENNVSSLSQA